MALIFSLSAECGTTRDGAKQFCAHFVDPLVGRDGSAHNLHKRILEDSEGGFWGLVVPDGVSRGGAGCEQEKREMRELALLLYDRLRTAPRFRYALIGIEADEFRTFNELDDDLVKLDFSGVVLADDFWRGLGSPPIFIPFSDGYRWRPFVKVR